MPTPVRAVRAVVSLFREFEQCARSGGMSMPQYRLLLFVRRGPRRAGELAALAEVKKPTITPMIAYLEAQGWIARVADEADRRSARLSITEAGKAAMDDMEARLSEALLRNVPEDVRDTTLTALDVVARALGASNEERFSRLSEELALDVIASGAQDS